MSTDGIDVAGPGLGQEILVVRGTDLQEAAGTLGMERHGAFESDEHWFGKVHTDANIMSGWHHHGDTMTIGYMLHGVARLEYGPGGSQSVEVRAGDFLLVPPHVIHREGNPTDEPGVVVLGRFGPGPPVVNVEGPDPG